MTAFLRRVSVALLFSFACIGALALDAAAQQTKNLKAIAGEYVAKGLEAQSAGRFDEAIGFYNQAYELLPHPLLLFNLGQAYRLKGDRVVALDYYRKYVAIEPNGRASKEAVEWTAQIERSMQEEAAAAARKFEQERMAEEARKAEAARKEEEARKAEAERKAEVARSAKQTSEARPDAKQVEGTGHAAAATTGAAPVRRDSSFSNEDTASFPWRKTAAGVALAGALVSGGAWYLYWQSAKDLHDDNMDGDANRKVLYSNISFFVSAALLGTSALLWFTAPDARPKPIARALRTAPMLTHEAAGLSLLGTF